MVGYFLFLFHRLWLFKFSVSDSIFFFFTQFNSLACSLSVKVAKELLKEGRKRRIYLLNFIFIFGFHTATLSRRNVFLDYKRTVTFPKRGIEIYSSFSVDNTFEVGGYVQLVFFMRYVEIAATGGKVSKRAAKQTRGFSPPAPAGEKLVFPVQVVAAE